MMCSLDIKDGMPFVRRSYDFNNNYYYVEMSDVYGEQFTISDHLLHNTHTRASASTHMYTCTCMIFFNCLHGRAINLEDGTTLNKYRSPEMWLATFDPKTGLVYGINIFYQDGAHLVTLNGTSGEVKNISILTPYQSLWFVDALALDIEGRKMYTYFYSVNITAALVTINIDTGKVISSAASDDPYFFPPYIQFYAPSMYDNMKGA
jgi:hypothetical protein